MMVRKGLLVVVAAVALLAAGGITAAAAPPPVPDPAPVAALQQEFLPVPDPMPLGETIEVAGAEVTVDNAFVEPSLDTFAMDEVRASITLRNSGDIAIDYDADAWLSSSATSTLRLRAGNDAVYPIDRAHPEHSIPGSNVTRVEPGYAARWTVGFQVPRAYSQELALEWLLLGQPIAAWDLLSISDPARWEGPTGEPAALGSSFAWNDVLTVSAVSMGELVCGDPAIEPVAHIMTVAFEVTNSGPYETVFPGIDDPATPATLLWTDGTAADFFVETFVGEAEELAKLAATKVHIPAGETVERAFVFSTLRDGRMVDVSTTPSVLVANAPAGRRLVDLAGVEPTIGVDPGYCDLGFAGGPLPYAVAPGVKFAVRGEGPFADPAAQDAAARAALKRVVAGASIYYDVNGRTFDGMTAVDLAPFTPGVIINDHVAGATELTAAIGKLYLDTDDADLIYVITESESGRWFCTAATAYTELREGSGADAETAGAACWSEVFQPDEPPPSSGEETEEEEEEEEDTS
jgi:hypothetical protein